LFGARDREYLTGLATAKLVRSLLAHALDHDERILAKTVTGLTNADRKPRDALGHALSDGRNGRKCPKPFCMGISLALKGSA
jgi:hypothetical protein